jgi:phosphopantothenoylcysteine decarboxylase/phosphopantothenate--cysteine ligase
MNLKNKRILITAGPTWVAIDRVRVISNIASGESGILLAEKFRNQGAKVTLLLGPGCACCLNRKIKVLRFIFFDQLKNLVAEELKRGRYDLVVHSAAVSDYRPAKVRSKKINSNLKRLKIELVPTSKIIDRIKELSLGVRLIGFKFEPEVAKAVIIKKARNLMERADLDMVVANTVKRNQYRAYILKDKMVYGPLLNKNKMADKLIRLIARL